MRPCLENLLCGAVAEWAWKVVGGINPDDASPGYKNVIIKPEPGGNITWSSGVFNSVRGSVVVAWTNSAPTSTYWLSVAVPANATASIYLPSTNLASITESGGSAALTAGILSYYSTNLPYWTNPGTLFQFGSGTYFFTVTNAAFY